MPLLYISTLFLGVAALVQLPVEYNRLVLIVLTYLLVGSMVAYCQLRLHPADQVTGLNWDVEHKMMSVLTAEERWVPVDKIYRRFSVLGLMQLLVLQRRDRYLPCWLFITPDRLEQGEARRLHVAITWGAPLAPNPATEN
ncbi:hypothetical protein CLV44_104170 [Marinobacterium halophilum]|uniref:Uncharacterized protein n=1 Tax=Marinobacterium halophilum TaxID=267374 RepID=A0A2P8F1G1_9GAMM|nr:hypothetical protein [Marinobacterium halophilum]PSL15559.1 hypothetical protein CLV44_104170 [Marinobacterium halophilum]